MHGYILNFSLKLVQMGKQSVTPIILINDWANRKHSTSLLAEIILGLFNCLLNVFPLVKNKSLFIELCLTCLNTHVVFRKLLYFIIIGTNKYVKIVFDMTEYIFDIFVFFFLSIISIN